jgi:hypothetical protein
VCLAQKLSSVGWRMLEWSAVMAGLCMLFLRARVDPALSGSTRLRRRRYGRPQTGRSPSTLPTATSRAHSSNDAQADRGAR